MTSVRVGAVVNSPNLVGWGTTTIRVHRRWKMSKVIECTCGFVVTGTNDRDLVANARGHARESHDWPDLRDEELLALATLVGD